MHLMDVVTTYIYGSIDTDLYMETPKGFKLPEATNPKPRNIYSIKLQIILYRLKQSKHTLYNRLSKYLLKEKYVNNLICSCVLIKKSEIGLTIIAIYVNDLNLIGTSEELTITTNYLKNEFEIKDLWNKILSWPTDRVLFKWHISQLVNICKESIKMIYIDKLHPLNSPMVICSLEVNKYLFRSKEENEELLSPEVSYLSTIGALMYLTNCTRLDIAFSINLLTRYNFALTRKHWNEIKHIL